LAVAAFFRDPWRRQPADESLILSPADGHVVGIDEIDVATPERPSERLRRISIFLSVLDAHTQRAPFAGTVRTVQHTPGKFLNAMSPESSIANENTMIWFDTEFGPVGVRQIAGLIARRVVTRVRPGDKLERADHIGLIRFGSRVELFVPLSARVLAVQGGFVRGGISALAERPTRAGAESQGEI
jgi:phosphatidylserine decarboxylase